MMKRILLVEDNQINQDVASGMLQVLGCEVEIAENGKEALTCLNERLFDLIFMDCQMPVLDGYKTTTQIRTQEKNEHKQPIPIVALTAHALVGDRERCLACGMSDYLAKPVKVTDLQKMLDRWLPSDNARNNEGGSAVEEVTSENVLDQAKVDEIKTIMGARFSLVVDKFSQNGTSLIKEIFSSYEAQDFEKLRSTLHTLKGSSGNLGASQLYDLCLKLEKSLTNESRDEVHIAALQQVEQAFQAAILHLQKAL